MSPRDTTKVDDPEVVEADSLQLLTASEAAALLKVTPTWVYTHARDGSLPHVRLGTPDGPVRFRYRELLDHLEAMRNAWRPGQRPETALRLVQGGGA